MKKFGSLRLFLLLVLVLVLSALPQIALYFGGRNLTKERLFGKEADINGVLVVYNIDTFEGGNCGKSAILENVCKKFEESNKGVFVLVKNVTVDQFLASETKPDVVSFGSGIFDEICDFVQSADFDVKMFENVAKSVECEGKIAALPWCLGAYFLFATEESLSRANMTYDNLFDCCMNASFERKSGKRTKKVYSLEMGSSKYHSAKFALEKVVEFEEQAVDENWSKQSYYDAYQKFVGGASTFLLGTQRDIARFENKLNQGAVSAYYSEMLQFSDLVQYCAPIKTENNAKFELSKRFCEFLLSDFVQKKVANFGMLPVVSVDDEDLNKKVEKLEIKKIF